MAKRKQRGRKLTNPLVRPPKCNSRKLTSSNTEESSKKHKANNHSSHKNGNSRSDGKKKKQFSTTAESLALIRAYHTLNKRLEQNARDDTISNEDERERKAEAIRSEQLALGGIESYQQASMYGARSSKFVCAHWVEPLLRTHINVSDTPAKESVKEESEVRTTTSSTTDRQPRILDVGAIDNQYLQYDWIDAVPIDLNAQHKSVIEADFFDYAVDHITKGTGPTFDAIVLSLVLNFQGDPRKRGDMLALAADHRLLRKCGLVFVALPSASLDNSRYCDEDYLIQICKTLGLNLVEQKRSAKLTLLAFQQTSSGPDGFQAYEVASKTFCYEKEISRQPAKSGKDRNNFAVMLRNSITQN